MLNYEEIREYVCRSRLINANDNFSRKIYIRAERLIKEENIKCFYLKNLFVEDKVLEIDLFCNDGRIVKVGLQDNNFIVTEVYDAKNIVKVTLKENHKYEYEKELFIQFNTGEVLSLNSKNDTNEHYVNEFSKIIEDIIGNYIYKIK